MAKQAVVNAVSQANTFDQWRVQTNEVITKTNNQEDYIGDLAYNNRTRIIEWQMYLQMVLQET